MQRSSCIFEHLVLDFCCSCNEHLRWDLSHWGFQSSRSIQKNISNGSPRIYRETKTRLIKCGQLPARHNFVINMRIRIITTTTPRTKLPGIRWLGGFTPWRMAQQTGTCYLMQHESCIALNTCASTLLKMSVSYKDIKPTTVRTEMLIFTPLVRNNHWFSFSLMSANTL